MTQIEFLVERNRDKMALIKILMADLEKRIEKLEQQQDALEKDNVIPFLN